ncbi:hypothetical protein GH714_001112 [Hevea brasiliensis]|uniref:Beta-galactosidase n=1 Tax=Hevea brasiliensis TaxID=3981 RepID=A0A6A6MZV4_HEVBR|nr:hypothetical protein GH714_001112 [Hevea brasiliensis]
MWKMSRENGLVLLLLFFSSWITSATATVTYDHKAIVINGQRRILISGSIHYPRSTPEMWPGLIQKAKEGGLDMIQTYVFWNGHEPTQGQYYFEDRYDIVKFIKLVQQAGLYVHLRIGPYICAEWNFGGFPMWLKYVPGIEFRTDNAPFKDAMQKFTTKIVAMMKAERLFEPQGGPIILSQIENEYGPVEWEIGSPGKSYTKWAAAMAVGLNTGVPWVMCKQQDALIQLLIPAMDSTVKATNQITTINQKCGQKIGLVEFGATVPYRPPEDTAFSVARFIANSGSFVNYYMYHGGTNFGRTSGLFMATSYDYDAPLDEYGLPHDPKWGHLRDLHKAIKLCEPALISVDPTITSLGKNQEIGAQSTQISMIPAVSGFSWQSYNDEVPVGYGQGTFTHDGLWEQKFITWDKTDYLWYMTNVNIDQSEGFLKNGKSPFLTVNSAGHVLHVFINGQLAGTVYGSLDDPKVKFSQNVNLKAGTNTISLLSATVGLPNVGVHYDTWNAGVMGPVTLSGLNQGTLDMSKWKWSYKIGVKGEDLNLGTSAGSSSVRWAQGPQLSKKQPLTWYKTSFDAPPGNDPLALDMYTMGKGQEVFCADIYDDQPAVQNWQGIVPTKPKAHLWCPPGHTISQIKFASYGWPQGRCGYFQQGKCHAQKSWDPFQSNCLGKQSCEVVVAPENFGGDPCPGSPKKLSVEVQCS